MDQMFLLEKFHTKITEHVIYRILTIFTEYLLFVYVTTSDILL